MSKRTPGPWHTDGVVIWASDNGGQNFDVPVCVMTSRTKNNGLTTPAENAPTCGLGNADLIAAAPTLLSAGWALERALHDYLQGNHPDKAERLSRAIDAHRLALTRAEGRA